MTVKPLIAFVGLCVAFAVIAEPRTLFWAIGEVESNHDPNAVGDGGVSRGTYQIGRLYWQDACEYLEANYDTLVKDDLVCEAIMVAYWARYNAKTDEEKIRKHNGGPRGMEKTSTVEYYSAVQNIRKGK